MGKNAKSDGKISETVTTKQKKKIQGKNGDVFKKVKNLSHVKLMDFLDVSMSRETMSNVSYVLSISTSTSALEDAQSEEEDQ